MFELEQQRLALDDAQRIARVGSWSWHTENDEASWSSEMYTIFERAPERGPATGEELFAHIHPDDREQLAARYATTFAGGPSFRARLSDRPGQRGHADSARTRPRTSGSSGLSIRDRAGRDRAAPGRAPAASRTRLWRGDHQLDARGVHAHPRRRDPGSQPGAVRADGLRSRGARRGARPISLLGSRGRRGDLASARAHRRAWP